MVLKKHTNLTQNICLCKLQGEKGYKHRNSTANFPGLRTVTLKSNNIFFGEFVLKDKSKNVKAVICYMISENILVEKYQVIILFPWNSRSSVDAINGFDCNIGSLCKTQHKPES